MRRRSAGFCTNGGPVYRAARAGAGVAAVATAALVAALAPPATYAADDSLAAREQAAFRAAVASVAESVVRISTVGGLERVDDQAVADGPTTGLVASADGYLVASAFNFAQRPSSVLVELPDGQRVPAEIVGRDTGRMLVLLKVEPPAPLIPARAAPLQEVHVGDWVVAVGRTLDRETPNVSVGVVSALRRMHGRVVQTDANTSTANYGGPLVDVRGRVVGVIVPMAPSSPGVAEASEVAGAEFYDSGIGFAVPLEHVLEVLPRWQREKDLKRGLLGIGMIKGNPHTTPPELTAVWPGSPAAAAGWKPGDRIVRVNGSPVATQTELRFHVVPRYAGDRLQVRLRREEEGAGRDLDTEIELIADLPARRPPFLGVLPARQDDRASDEPRGLLVRGVWPESPAARAGIEPGDRIAELDGAQISDLGDALKRLQAHAPGESVRLEAARDGEAMKLEVTLADLPGEPLAAQDMPEADAPPAEGGKRPKLEDLRLPEFSQIARWRAPAGDGPPPGVLVWLGERGGEAARSAADAWGSVLDRRRIAWVGLEPAGASGWSADDREYLERVLPVVVRRVGGDPRRVVVAGAGKAAQLGYALALARGGAIQGVLALDSPLPRTATISPATPGDRLTVLSVETRDSPLRPVIRQDLARLEDAGYAVGRITLAPRDDAPADFDAETRAAVGRWIDGLDRF